MRLALSIAVSLGGTLAHASEDSHLLRLDGHLVKWGSPELGAAADVTYAFVAQPTRFPGARNCRSMAPLVAFLTASDIPPERFQKETEAALAAWEAIADISFRRSADPSTADILIGTQANPRGWAYADVSYAPSETTGARSIERSLICLNPTRPWTVGFDAAPGAYDLGYVLMHEAGHAIGLDHPASTDQVMSHTYPERFRGLQAGDVDGAVSLYGKREPESVLRQASAAAGDRATRPAD